MCQQLITDVWDRNQGKSLFDKIIECSQILSAWGQDITGSFKKRIHAHKRIIKTLKGHRDDRSAHILKENQKNLAEVYAQQETFWKQRSK